jgi:hypothetical protein
MKYLTINSLVILITVLLSSSCKNYKEEEATQQKFSDNKSADSLATDSLLYSIGNSGWWAVSGVYTHSNIIISLCEYERRGVNPNLPDSSLSLLIKKGIIPEYDLKIVGGYDPPDKFIPPKKIDYSHHKSKLPNVVYYEITVAPSMNPYYKLDKVVGKLYCFYLRREGGFYISDTTEKYGSFIVKTPPFIKPPSYALDAPKKLVISSLDEKSKSLCGEYEKILTKPYRIIRDEEVSKTTK